MNWRICHFITQRLLLINNTNERHKLNDRYDRYCGLVPNIFHCYMKSEFRPVLNGICEWTIKVHLN